MKDVNILLKNGININKCIEYFGTIEVYNDTMSDFYNSANDRYSKLEMFFNKNDYNNYIVEIHSLKSDSRYLGFNNLSIISYNMELKYNEKDINYIKNNHAFLLSEFAKAYNISKRYLAIDNINNKEITQNNNESINNDSQINTLENNYKFQNNLSNVMPTSLKVKPVSNYIGEGIQKVKSVVPENIISNDIVKINMNNNKSHPLIKPKLMKNKILVVDDSKLIVKFITRALSNDYELIIANNGQEAIDLLEKSNFAKSISYVLLDLNMPIVDGYGVLEYCKSKNLFSSLQIIVESGIEDAASLDKVNSYPIVGIILKPFKDDDLRRIIEKSTLSFF